MREIKVTFYKTENNIVIIIYRVLKNRVYVEINWLVKHGLNLTLQQVSYLVYSIGTRIGTVISVLLNANRNFANTRAAWRTGSAFVHNWVETLGSLVPFLLKVSLWLLRLLDFGWCSCCGILLLLLLLPDVG